MLGIIRVKDFGPYRDSCLQIGLDLTPSYNADFDGDDCTLIVVRGLESRQEASRIISAMSNAFKIGRNHVSPSHMDVHSFLWYTTHFYNSNTNKVTSSIELRDSRIIALCPTPESKDKLQRLAINPPDLRSMFSECITSSNASILKGSNQSVMGYRGRMARMASSYFTTSSNGEVSKGEEPLPYTLTETIRPLYRNSFGIPAIRGISKITKQGMQNTLSKKKQQEGIVGDNIDPIREILLGPTSSVVFFSVDSKVIPIVISMEVQTLQELYSSYAAFHGSSERFVYSCYSPRILAMISDRNEKQSAAERGVAYLCVACSINMDLDEALAVKCILLDLSFDSEKGLIENLKTIVTEKKRTSSFLAISQSVWYSSSFVREYANDAEWKRATVFFEHCMLSSFTEIPSISQGGEESPP